MDASVCDVVIFPLIGAGKRYVVRLGVTREEAIDVRNALIPFMPSLYLIDFV